MSFQNKVVWITGASSGIGEALAYAFARQKCKLVLSARRADELERVKKSCNLPDGDVMILPLDVSDVSKAGESAQKIVERFGGIDILVNNAGFSHWSKIKDTKLDVIKRIMDTNYLGGVALTKAVLPFMLNKKSGNIVVISSVLGKMFTAKQGAYSASKHALHGLYDTLRAEIAGDGVKVLLVCPGFVHTNVAKNSLNKEGQPINKDNPLIINGLEPSYVANKILGAIESNKQQIVIAAPREKAAFFLNQHFPSLFGKVMARFKLV